MKKNFQLMREDFENLLGWLSTDREQAAILYEEIRQGLIRYFRFRGCADEEALADETMNRVSVKVLNFTADKNVETISFFYGFAKNIYREYLSRRRKEVRYDPALNYASPNHHERFDIEESRHKCLENCLQKLSDPDRKLVVRYYSESKIAKIELRRKIAEELELNAGTLHTKVYRIRNTLRKCIQKCLDENNR